MWFLRHWGNTESFESCCHSFSLICFQICACQNKTALLDCLFGCYEAVTHLWIRLSIKVLLKSVTLSFCWQISHCSALNPGNSLVNNPHKEHRQRHLLTHHPWPKVKFGSRVKCAHEKAAACCCHPCVHGGLRVSVKLCWSYEPRWRLLQSSTSSLLPPRRRRILMCRSWLTNTPKT